jgi:hypothetical protein
MRAKRANASKASFCGMAAGTLARYGRSSTASGSGNQTFAHSAQQIAFQTYLNAMDQTNERKVAIEREIVALLPRLVSRSRG